jgi:hypothetical protein
VVRNVDAFRSRYGQAALILGSYAGTTTNLANAGEPITIVDRFEQPLVNFTYSDDWYPVTDGGGPTLEVIDPASNPDLNLSTSWRPSATPGGSPGFDAAAPAVTAVYVDSTAWTPAFRSHLDNSGLGSGALGLRVPARAEQLLSLPYNNINRIRVQFSTAVSVQQADLSVRGVSVANYGFAAGGFTYDPTTFTATWTLNTNLGRDKLLLDLDGDAPAGVAATAGGALLDGEWVNGSPSQIFGSGNGTPGGDFEFRLNILPGDANGDGVVNVTDLGALSTHFNQSPRGPREGEFSGDGVVNVTDLGILSTNFNRSLPAGNPTLVAAARAAVPARGTSSSPVPRPAKSAPRPAATAPAHRPPRPTNLFAAVPIRMGNLPRRDDAGVLPA